MSCRHDCPKPPLFPVEIFNRPGLERIAYRIGDYASFREHMLARLDHALELARWTHRGADDPGIALLECSAIAGEIVSFYQQLYANELYLRTADWHESVSRLVALTGYRLAPGLGGRATFALAVDGEKPVKVPMGFGFKAKLEGADTPAIFESLSEVTAYPWLSRFSLYCPRRGRRNIRTDETVLELKTVECETGLAARQAVELNPGDRLMLVPPTSFWDSNIRFRYSLLDDIQVHEILAVKKVETVLDRILIHLEGKLRLPPTVTEEAMHAYKIGRSFRHFGHNAPTRISTIDDNTGIMAFRDTTFKRTVERSFSSTSSDFFSMLGPKEMPLDAEVDDLAAGGKLIITADLLFMVQHTTSRQRNEGQRWWTHEAATMTVVRQIDRVYKDTLTWGGLSGSSTVLRLAEKLVTNNRINNERFDNIRRVEFHEVVSPRLTLCAESNGRSESFGSNAELAFFGTRAEAVALAGRELLLEGEEGVQQIVRVENSEDEFPLSDRDETNPWLWTVRLDRCHQFRPEAFDERDNRVTVYGNLVHTDQGETQARIAIGSGDAREVFQTFKLPKAPLTYHLHNERTPPHVSELEIYVDGVLWQRVESFFDSKSKDHVYIVRQDELGNSLVQFGDGITGARLLSGRNNVVARYRVGSGAYGPLEEGKLPKAMGRLKPLTKVWMREAATLGAMPEDTNSAREAAPARMQSLGRLVGLSDYEAEALDLPGVFKARAEWVAPNGTPLLRLVVLTDGGTSSEARAVADAMAAANRCRGASRFPIVTVPGIRQYLYLGLEVGYSSNHLAEDIDTAIRLTLGVQHTEEEPEDGLFGYMQRRFGEGTHLSHIIGTVQQVPGVTWVRADGFQLLSLGSVSEPDPTALAVPTAPVCNEAIDCPGHALLALHAKHFNLRPFKVGDAEECV